MGGGRSYVRFLKDQTMTSKQKGRVSISETTELAAALIFAIWKRIISNQEEAAA